MIEKKWNLGGGIRCGRVLIFDAKASVGYEALNIGYEFIKEKDHRVVCIIKKYILGFKQKSVKSINQIWLEAG